MLQCFQVISQLIHGTSSYYHRRHSFISQYPCQRHFSQRLPTAMGYFIQLPGSFYFLRCHLRALQETGRTGSSRMFRDTRYLSVNNPCAKGEKAIKPEPDAAANGRISASTARSNILYRYWLIRQGTPAFANIS
jgi:hypothetical protein